MSVKPEPDGVTPLTTREGILAAARRLIAEERELSIAAVAAEAGVSRQTIHHHFGGAKGLHAALAAEGLLAPATDEEPTRERLIEAAVRLLSGPGGGLVSIEGIAAEAGMTKGAVYHHFADRGELLRAVARRVSPVDELSGQLQSVPDLPAREGLIEIARAYYGFMRTRTDLIRNLATNSSRDPEVTQVVMNEIVGQGAPLLVGWMMLQMSRGAIRPVDPSLVIQALFGPAFMLVVMGPALLDDVSKRGIHPAVDNVEAYVDLLLEGIRAGSDSK
jgi:AcrR family transcriptional regulator